MRKVKVLKIYIFVLLSILVNSSVYALSTTIEKDQKVCGCIIPCPEEPKN